MSSNRSFYIASHCILSKNLAECVLDFLKIPILMYKMNALSYLMQFSSRRKSFNSDTFKVHFTQCSPIVFGGDSILTTLNVSIYLKSLGFLQNEEFRKSLLFTSCKKTCQNISSESFPKNNIFFRNVSYSFGISEFYSKYIDTLHIK